MAKREDNSIRRAAKSQPNQTSHVARIHAVTDYIAANLARPHTLDELAKIAHLSKFHFHRMYRAVTGQTITSTVNRLRLEAAAATLIYQTKRPITRIAMDQGYSSSANFTKAFSKHFGCSPTAYRRGRHGRYSGDTFSKNGKDRPLKVAEHDLTGQQVRVRQQQAVKLAYVRARGQYEQMKIRKMHDQVQLWAESRRAVAERALSVGITWSDSHIVDAVDWTYDACVAVKPATRGDRQVGLRNLEAGLVAELGVTLTFDDSHDLSPYWDWLVGSWFVNSGYELGHRPSFELYENQPEGQPPGTPETFVVRLCLPINKTPRRQ